MQKLLIDLRHQRDNLDKVINCVEHVINDRVTENGSTYKKRGRPFGSKTGIAAIREALVKHAVDGIPLR